MQQICVTALLCFILNNSYTQVNSSIVYFQSAEYNLTAHSKAELNSLIKNIDPSKLKIILVSGYADSTGNTNSNKSLSAKRVQAVCNQLKVNGILSKKIKVNYYGEENPIKTKSFYNAKENRIVKIKIVYIDEKSKNYTAIKSTKYSETRKYLEKLKDVQTFSAIGLQPTIIKSKSGTVFSFPDSAFVDKKGNIVKGNVEIKITEVFKKSEMIINSLQTTSDGKILETGGMFNVNAFANGQAVYLRNGKNYTFELPEAKFKDSMSLFYGKDSAGITNWIPTDVRIAKPGLRAVVTKGGLKIKDGLTERGKIDSVKLLCCTEYKEYTKSSFYEFSSKISVLHLGWINCDRFLTNTEPATIYASFNNPDEDNSIAVCLIFKKLNSIMQATYINGNYRFSNIPKGELATLIAYKVKNKETFYDSKMIKIVNNAKLDINLTKITEEEFQGKLAEFK